MVKARQVDERRRIVLPREFRPGSDVIIERLDDDTWILKQHRSDPNIKMVMVRTIDRLPDDAEWRKVENAFGRAAYGKIHSPED
jgi:hypothetical protein